MSERDVRDEQPTEQPRPEDIPEDVPTSPPAERATPPPGDERPGVPWGLAAFLVLAVALVVFTWQNTQAVELRLLGWTWEIPLAILIIGVVVFSVALDEILGVVIRHRRRRRAQERAELKRLRAESKGK